MISPERERSRCGRGDREIGLAQARHPVNLRGPLVANRHTLVGKQCVPANVSTFNQQHPLQTNRAAAA